MTLRTSALANNCSKASSPLPDESRDLFFRACRDRTATTHGLRCMAAPFDRCTAYFGAPFHAHTLGCGQTIVVRLAGTLEAGPGIPRSEYMRRRLMSESGLGCVKTKSDLVVMPSGRQIFAFFCSSHDHRAQNSGCGYTA